MRGWATKAISISILVLICFTTGTAPLSFPSIPEVSAQPTVPYTLGNWTYVSKPFLPIKINASQIPVGSNWTYVYTLEANSAYQVYCYGEWVDYSSESNKTDYDIFVYDPAGNLESSHTEAAGMPEYLSNGADHQFFVPQQSGNYSFLLRNDPRESKGAEEATFMLIEHVEAGRWYTRYMEGKFLDEPVEKTSWAYEFNTTSKRIEIWVEVPETLDMYEARLYTMANPSTEVGTYLKGVPLAWEPGLYGNTSDIYGGYSVESDGPRFNDAMASCEYLGADMLINFTAPAGENLLYHLVFIAENGEGIINFMVKTDFDAPQISLLNPVKKMNSGNETKISAYIEEQFTLETVTLNYTTDNWTSTAATEMIAAKNHTYTAIIPGQTAGTGVNYTVLARDTSGNSAEVEDSYVVKNSANITLDLASSVVYCGENVTVTGSTPVGGTNVSLTYGMFNYTGLSDFTSADFAALNFTADDNAVSRLVSTTSSGSFTDDFSPDRVGTWIVIAGWNGTETYFGASNSYVSFTVQKVAMTLLCNITSKSVTIGNNITVVGSVYPEVENLNVTVTFISANSTIVQTACTSSNGTFLVSWKPDLKGLWQINAVLAEDAERSPAYSNSLSFTVNDTWLNQYMLYIIGGVAGAVAVVVILFILRRRRYG